MRNNAPTQRLAWGYAILISLAIVQQFFVYLHLYMNQSYTKLDVVLSIASLGALAAGLCFLLVYPSY